MSKRKSFSAEFKLEAVRALTSGKPAAELARELGVPRNQLYQWRSKYQSSGTQDAFPGKGRRTGNDEKLAALQRENERLKEENEILKKAALYFAKECP
jgi:transposase-like protein